MASFMLFETDTEITTFDLPLERTIKLRQYGGDAAGNRLDVAPTASSATGLDVAILPDKLPGASTAFTARGTQVGARMYLSAFVADGTRSRTYAPNLTLNVGGLPHKQPGYSVDLLSDLAISGNSTKVWQYSQIVNGPTEAQNILSQDPTKSTLDCGDVAAGYGKKFFGKDTNTTYIRYYKPQKSDKKADLRFEEGVMRTAISRMQRLLDSGIVVRVWVVDADGFDGMNIQGDLKTHFIALIGYSSTSFMYFDPYPGGSKMTYSGGMYGGKEVPFLGELEFDALKLNLGIRSPGGQSGVFDFTVIAGPM